VHLHLSTFLIACYTCFVPPQLFLETLQLIRLLSSFLILLFATKSFAGYHIAFDAGFDEFAESQGFKSFKDYMQKRDKCAAFINDIDNSTGNHTNLNKKHLDVSPPEDYHWMVEDGYHTLMQNPINGYVKHPGSSLKAKVPIFPVYLIKPKNLENEIGSETNTSFLEVAPPKGYHWMSNGQTYSLMKTPLSGYGPHSGSSLVANFYLYKRQKSISNKIGVSQNYDGADDNSASEKASEFLYVKLTGKKAPDLDELFQDIDKKLWNKNLCSLKMFIDDQMLTTVLETYLTGAKGNLSGVKAPRPASEWGY